MNKVLSVLLAFGTASIIGLGCIFPDYGIVVGARCGEEWGAQTVGAYGYDAADSKVWIKTQSGDWVTWKVCLTEAAAVQMADVESELAAEFLFIAQDQCLQRAFELGLTDTDQTCTTTADIVYFGECLLDYCEAAETGGNDEVDDGETGGSEDTEETEGDLGSLSELDIDQEVALINGEYVISQLLIETALGDPIGIYDDGTRAKQVFDVTGNPYGFEISGVTTGNLGDALGFQNGDIITRVNGEPTQTLEDLMTVMEDLLEANTASVTVLRGSSVLTLNYRRGM